MLCPGWDSAFLLNTVSGNYSALEIDSFSEGRKLPSQLSRHLEAAFDVWEERATEQVRASTT